MNFTPPYIYEGLFDDEERERSRDSAKQELASLLDLPVECLPSFVADQCSLGNLHTPKAQQMHDAYRQLANASQERAGILTGIVGGAIALAPKRWRC